MAYLLSWKRYIIYNYKKQHKKISEHFIFQIGGPLSLRELGYQCIYIFAIFFIKECKLLCDAKRKVDMNDFADDDEEGCYDYSLLTALR